MAENNSSLFSCCVRSFFKCFSVVLGLIAAGVILVILIASFTPSSSLPEKASVIIAPDADGKRSHFLTEKPTILRIDLNGVIGEGALTSENIEEILLESQEDELSGHVKGILLYLNTPGGIAVDGDNIYRALLAYKQKYNVPIYSYVDGLCASAGMYIAAASDKILASPASIIGSIGVLLGPAFNFSGAMEKIGVQSLTLTEGKNKDMLNPFRPWKPGEQDSLKAITKDLYDRFVDIIVAARPNLDKEKLINEYGAQVFASAKAQALGYIDNGDSNYSSALKELTLAAGIKEKEEYQVVKLEMQRSFFSELAKAKFPFANGKVIHTFQVDPYITPNMSGKFLYLYQPGMYP